MRSILHELKHVEQQNKYGETFIQVYAFQTFASIVTSSLKRKISIESIHANIYLENEALDAAEHMMSKVKLQCPQNNCLLSPLNK